MIYDLSLIYAHNQIHEHMSGEVRHRKKPPSKNAMTFQQSVTVLCSLSVTKAVLNLIAVIFVLLV